MTLILSCFNGVIAFAKRMFDNYILILSCLFHVNGDVIEIEVETEIDHLCPKPKSYWSDISEFTSD